MLSQRRGWVGGAVLVFTLVSLVWAPQARGQQAEIIKFNSQPLRVVGGQTFVFSLACTVESLERCNVSVVFFNQNGVVISRQTATIPNNGTRDFSVFRATAATLRVEAQVTIETIIFAPQSADEATSAVPLPPASPRSPRADVQIRNSSGGVTVALGVEDDPKGRMQ